MEFINNLKIVLKDNFRKEAFQILLIIFFTTILELLGLSLIIPILIFFFDGDNVHNIFIIKELQKNFAFQNILQLVIFSTLTLYFIKNLVLSFFALKETNFVWKLKKQLSEKLLKFYLLDEDNFLLKNNSSTILNILTKEISYLTHLIFNTLIFISEFLIIFSILLIMLFIETKIFSFLLLIIVFFFSLIILISKKKIVKLSNERIIADTKYLRDSFQAIEASREIKIYDKSYYFLDRFRDTNNDVYNINRKLELFQKLPRFWLEYTLLCFVLILILFLNKSGTQTNNIALILSLLGVVAARVLPSANKLYQSYQKIKIYFPSLRIIAQKISNTENQIISNKNYIQNKNNLNFNNSIKFERVFFSYPNKNVFKDISFHINKNDMVGIYGSNGSGKSTLLDLLFGFLFPQKGKILVDGIDIRSNLKSWQSKISYIPQKIYLMDSTILENIIFKKNLNVDEKINLEECLELSDLKSMMIEFTDGLDTIVGERGSKISGGQQQRIGLARALFAKPEILVMDETTSSIDQNSSDLILNSVRKMKNITRIIISHNLEILDKCDVNLKVSKEKIEELKI